MPQCMRLAEMTSPFLLQLHPYQTTHRRPPEPSGDLGGVGPVDLRDSREGVRRPTGRRLTRNSTLPFCDPLDPVGRQLVWPQEPTNRDPLPVVVPLNHRVSARRETRRILSCRIRSTISPQGAFRIQPPATAKRNCCRGNHQISYQSAPKGGTYLEVAVGARPAPERGWISTAKPTGVVLDPIRLFTHRLTVYWLCPSLPRILGPG